MPRDSPTPHASTPHHSHHYATGDEAPGTQADEIARDAIPVVAKALAECAFPARKEDLLARVRGWRIPFRSGHIRPDLALAQVRAEEFASAEDAARAMYASGALAAAVGSEGRVKDYFQGGNA